MSGASDCARSIRARILKRAICRASLPHHRDDGSTRTGVDITALGISKTTAHRLVSNLEELGFLKYGIEHRHYQVGPRLKEHATNVLTTSFSHGPSTHVSWSFQGALRKP
ncbi:helix-turn-helix domain-containing protein [Paraburkholderia sp. WC7.3g]|uniref:helix-turn-helix domain-containing protein n=1 Tax=Paraburkholderia sp. WC7.3g TaxID=2991070 RepID=UPI003D1AD11B